MADSVMDSYNSRLIASASARQYESATLPAKQLGIELRNGQLSEKQQRQSRYDGGLEEDGITHRPLVPVQPAEPLAHIARERQRVHLEHQERRNEYKEVLLAGCQLCISAHYMLPQSFGQECTLGEQGEIEAGDVSQAAGLPWVFDDSTGELRHFLEIWQAMRRPSMILQRTPLSSRSAWAWTFVFCTITATITSVHHHA